jgi:hypothetical protein
MFKRLHNARLKAFDSLGVNCSAAIEDDDDLPV